MPRLALNYMRLCAMLSFLLISIGILVSYTTIPHFIAISLNHYYSVYWHTLNQLLQISVSFMLFAFCVEKKKNIYWLYHCIALSLLGLFVYKLIVLFEFGDVIFAAIS